MGVIGDTLSAARTRGAVDLEQVEAATGIRTRYLRAIEEEDWDALPEEFYARSFIRKYAQFLGVDPGPLVEDYRRQRGTPVQADAPTSPFARTGSRRAEALRRRRKRQAAYSWAGVALLVAGVIVAILILIGGGEEGGGSKGATSSGGGGAGGSGKAGGKSAGNGGGPKQGGGKGGTAKGESGAPRISRRFYRPATVKLTIEPTAEVWACVLDAQGKPLVDGLSLPAGEIVGPFHSRSYAAAFGNGSVALRVDGKRAATPSSPSPIGLTIDRHGRVHELAEGQRPSCE